MALLICINSFTSSCHGQFHWGKDLQMELNQWSRMMALKAEQNKANNQQQQQQPQEEEQEPEIDPEDESASKFRNAVSYISCLCCIR